jgi:Hg(II)-responsive transcriptional regulator
MRSGELAAEAGVNVQTVRYYERRGLLQVPPRSPSGYRSYPRQAVEVIRFVKRSQELGFTLDEVRELLHLAEGGPAACRPARELAQRRISDLERRITELQRMKNSLGQLVDTCELPRSDRRCPLIPDLPWESPSAPTGSRRTGKGSR